jgi:CheY-like chemotaxis protein
MAESKTILLADDSVTIQKVVELTFMDENFRVIPVGNGAEAIAWLGESTPDVVIADVHMPGADGYEVCRRSKEIHPEVPVLLLVGTFEAFDADAASRSGADGHLKKPFDSQELLRRVRDLASASRVASPSPAVREPAAAPELSAALEIEEQMWEPLPDEPADSADLPAYSTAAEPEEPDPASAATAFVPFQPQPASPPPASAFSTGFGDAAPAAATGALSDDDVDRIARRVIELLGDKPVRDVAWEVVPDLAEVLLKTRIRELEASVE